MKKHLHKLGGFVQRLRSVAPRLLPWLYLIVKVILDMTSDYNHVDAYGGLTDSKLVRAV